MERDTEAWHKTVHSLIISIAALPVRVTETRSYVSDSLEASVFDSRVKARRNGFHKILEQQYCPGVNKHPPSLTDFTNVVICFK